MEEFRVQGGGLYPVVFCRLLPLRKMRFFIFLSRLLFGLILSTTPGDGRIYAKTASPADGSPCGARIAKRVDGKLGSVDNHSLTKAVDMSRSVLLDPDPQLTESATEVGLLDPSGLGPERTRAHRWETADVPWLSTVKLPWGLEVKLLNISKSGLLVESGSKLDPGSTTIFHLSGPNKNLTVSARIVRSQVGAVTSRGVKYLAAALFDKTIDALEQRRATPQRSIAAPKALADLLARVMEERENGSDPAMLRASFEEGIKRLVSAREVEIREEASAADGSELVCFPVPANRGFRTTLQATFEPNDTPQADEVRILKAAATLAAFILQFENISRDFAVNDRETSKAVSEW
jgi:hypothetical protein